MANSESHQSGELSPDGMVGDGAKARFLSERRVSRKIFGAGGWRARICQTP